MHAFRAENGTSRPGERRRREGDERLKKRRVNVYHGAPPSASNSDATRDTPTDCECTVHRHVPVRGRARIKLNIVRAAQRGASRRRFPEGVYNRLARIIRALFVTRETRRANGGDGNEREGSERNVIFASETNTPVLTYDVRSFRKISACYRRRLRK